MAGSDRVAALRRARQRQARIETATARAIRAQVSVSRAMKARAASAELHDERVRRAEESAASELPNSHAFVEQRTPRPRFSAGPRVRYGEW
jgi:hypothetical protein